MAHLWAMWLRYPCRLGDPHRFRAEGQNQKWRTCGQSGYVTPAVLGIPTAAERGAKSEVAHLWARLLRQSCRLGDLHCFKAGGIFKSGPLVGNVATAPLRLGDPHRCRGGAKIRSGTLAGNVATSPLPSRESPPLQSGGQNQKWPTCGQCGYVTPAVSGIPTASERGGKFRSGPLVGNVATLPLRFGDPHRCKAGGKIRSGPVVGKVATSPVPSRRSPLLQSGGDIQKWPTCGQCGYVTPASRGSPPLQRGGQNQKWHTCGQCGYVTPAVSGIPTAAERGAKSEVAHMWTMWLRHPCRLGDSHCFRAGGEIQKWPTCGQSGYVTPAFRGSPPLQSGGAKSEVAHLWAMWLRHHCRLGDPHCFKAGGKIRSGPLVGNVATSPLPSRRSPLLQSGGDIQKWPTCGQCGYVTPASRGSPPLHRGGQNQKWPTCGQFGYVSPTVSGIPTAAERGGKMGSGPLVDNVATSPLPSRGSPLLQSGGGNSEVAHFWAMWLRYPCVSGIPAAA